MALKIQLGVSKKVGLPDYGSLGASCSMEVELDQSFDPDEDGSLQQQIKQVYRACRQAVEEELAAYAKPAAAGHSTDHHGAEAPLDQTANGRNGSNGHRASQKQLDYIQQLAGQIRGLGSRRLEALAAKMHSKPISELSSLEASGLIDVLKEIKAGKIDLNVALAGAAS
jgi:hypothetical protein